MTDHITTTQEIYAAFGQGDLPAILERIDDRPDWCMDLPEEVHGAKAVPFLRHVSSKDDVAAIYFGNVAKSLNTHRFVPKSFFADGDDVIVVLEHEFTVRSTGRRVDIEEIHHFTFGADGRIVRYRPFLVLEVTESRVL